MNIPDYSDLEFEKLFAQIQKDYHDFQVYSSEESDSDFLKNIRADMQREFNSGLDISFGKNHAKIIARSKTQPSVWGFVVIKDTMGFKRGDILKAAGWNAPALNKARGNIRKDTLDLTWVKWTGPAYL